MKMQNSTTAAAVFIGRWTPKVLFSLREKPHRHGELRRNLAAFLNACLPGHFAASNLRG